MRSGRRVESGHAPHRDFHDGARRRGDHIGRERRDPRFLKPYRKLCEVRLCQKSHTASCHVGAPPRGRARLSAAVLCRSEITQTHIHRHIHTRRDPCVPCVPCVSRLPPVSFYGKLSWVLARDRERAPTRRRARGMRAFGRSSFFRVEPLFRKVRCTPARARNSSLSFTQLSPVEPHNL